MTQQRLKAAATLALALSACAPDIPTTPAADKVTARFDPGASPAVVPTPNSLALDPATGRLAITAPEGASAADVEFIGYLNSLDGYPTSSSATATFAGALDAASVTAQSVRVLDLTASLAPVEGATLAYAAPGPDAVSRVTVQPPQGGWLPGHSYAVALLAGQDGLKGEGGLPVVGSSAWALIRSADPLVACPGDDLASADCRVVPSVIPAVSTDLEARAAEQLATAKRLEQLRRFYEPLLDALESKGVARADVALLWTYRTTSFPTAVFDPGAAVPRVPTPNDLARDPTTGLVKAPVDPASPAAQQEFTRDYLNTLDGFPVSATAAATIAAGDLDPATVSATTVRVLDVTAPGSAVQVGVSYGADTDTLALTPPQGGWTKGHTYAVALVGGASGIKGADAKPLVASAPWALARMEASLLTCSDLSSATCKVNGATLPLSLDQARALERLRRGYAPVLDALDAAGLARADVPLLWTFSAVSFPEATFNPDPAAPVIPFPNNLVLGTNGKVSLPCPAADLTCSTSLAGQLTAGLNTLDGFSTTAPLVSENSASLGAIDVGTLDRATLPAGTGLLNLMPGGAQPVVNACVSCVASAQPPQVPEELQLVPSFPLAEKSVYAAYLTRTLKSQDGKPVVASPTFALLRSSAELAVDGKSQVSVLSDAQAVQLEAARLKLKPAIDALAAAGIARKDLALAWAFRTQTTVSALKALAGVPAQLGALGALPATAENVGVDAQLTGYFAVTFGAGNHVAAVYTGTLRTANLLTGPGGTLDPAAPAIERIPFILTLPQGTAPAGGWPVTLFGHGLTGSRGNMLGIANTLAAVGQATFAIDTVWHGERSDCRGSKAAIGAPTDNAACVSGDVCSATTGKCVTSSGDPGRFAMKSDGITPLISGWNIINAQNLFATRDSFRQQVVDLSQVERVLKATGTGSLAAQGIPLDGSAVTYVGQSLGGILGSLFTAASPTLGNAVLNVPGGDPVGILETAPAFAPQFAGVKAMLAASGMAEGTPGYDTFLRTARWIMDPADPSNAATGLLNDGAPASRKVLIQYITGDQVVPNGTTQSLLDSALRPETSRRVDVFQFDPLLSARPACGRHGFLLQPASTSSSCSFSDPDTTAAAQGQVAAYLTTGVLP